MLLIGFKLTTNPENTLQAIQKLFQETNADLIIHNQLSEVTFDRHITRLYDSMTQIAEAQTKSDLAHKLVSYLKEKPRHDLNP